MATANTSYIQLVHQHFLSEICVDHLNQRCTTCCRAAACGLR